jgi:hypothetical protein
MQVNVTLVGRPSANWEAFDLGRSRLYVVVGRSAKSRGYFPMDFWGVPYTAKLLRVARAHQRKILKLMEDYGWRDGRTAVIRIDL